MLPGRPLERRATGRGDGWSPPVGLARDERDRIPPTGRQPPRGPEQLTGPLACSYTRYMAAKGDPEQKRTPAGLRRRSELMEAAVLLRRRERVRPHARLRHRRARSASARASSTGTSTAKDALFREIFDDTGRRLRLFQGAFIADETGPHAPDRERHRRVVRLHRPERARVRVARPRVDGGPASAVASRHACTSSTPHVTSRTRCDAGVDP